MARNLTFRSVHKLLFLMSCTNVLKVLITGELIQKCNTTEIAKLSFISCMVHADKYDLFYVRMSDIFFHIFKIAKIVTLQLS